MRTFSAGSIREFATVYASNVFEHLDHDTIDASLADIGRALSPGGRPIHVQPNFHLDPHCYFDGCTHRTVRTDRSRAVFVNARGLRVVHEEPRLLPLTMKSKPPFSHRLVPIFLELPNRPLAGQMLVSAQRP